MKIIVPAAILWYSLNIPWGSLYYEPPILIYFFGTLTPCFFCPRTIKHRRVWRKNVQSVNFAFTVNLINKYRCNDYSNSYQILIFYEIYWYITILSNIISYQILILQIFCFKREHLHYLRIRNLLIWMYFLKCCSTITFSWLLWKTFPSKTFFWGKKVSDVSPLLP